MNIGIIVHTHTGNTYAVAEKIKARLNEAGHAAVIEKVTATDDLENDPNKISLGNKPDPDLYDVLIFGSPIHGAAPTGTMKAYFKQIPTLNQKKVCCFMTGFFPFAWMGDSRALKQLAALCKAKGGQVSATGLINWTHWKRKQQIADLADKIVLAVQ